ncbi:lysine N(6)-hydroxylase/L-ornithine N(5)-oxygenase family protein [Alkalihalophilus sp. As8PL]|uniref:L-lysine N6-monooxygenase MbtG n=1 Tax=Alkalihalophilus sp. As8PL TaxID=3237103 RepID=A0AB39BV10_9BACI
MSTTYNHRLLDVIGIGLGPFNLGLAALMEESTDIQSIFFDQKPHFEWHGGLLIEETTLQVPFLADVVTMSNPKSHYSFLNYLHEQERLYKFYFLERFHIPRREYNHYCKWVSEQLSNCQFGKKVTSIEWEEEVFRIETEDVETGEYTYYYAKHIVLGIGSVPNVPKNMIGDSNERIFHSAKFLQHRERLRQAESISVVGSGQSAAEVFLELLKEQPIYNYRLDWFTRSRGFFPMEYSKLGLEHFSPDYTHYFYSLSQEKKDEQLPKQDLLYKGISATTISEIYDLLYEHSVGGEDPPVRLLAKTEVTDVVEINKGEKIQLQCNQWELDQSFTHESEFVVAATGYKHPIPSFLRNVQSLIDWDEKGRYCVGENYQLKLTDDVDNNIFIQNGEMHTHGVGAPDLGLGAYRNATIINQLANRDIFRVRKRNVFQQFGVH